MNNKKGFTLIELIAVIIVLSIIALIATPIVTGIMESSRKKAYDNIVTNIEDSAYKYSIYNNLGYSELYKPLQLSEIQNSGYLESKDIIDPRNNEKMDGCVAYKWDVSKNQYHFVYQEECDPQSLFPKVEISIPNISDIDNTEWLQEKIQLEVKDAYRSYKYCVSKEKKCTPDKDYKGKITIQETGRNIYICVTGFMGEDEGLTACVGPYNVDPDKPVLALKEVKTLSSRITVTATCTDDISQVKSLQYSINDGAYQNSNVFKNLKSGKYNVKVRCIDNALHEVTANKEVTLDVIPVPEIIQISQKPTDTKTYPKYATERVIRITYYNENVQSPKYYYSTDGENWTQLTSGTTKDLTFTSNGKVYAKTTDEAGNVASASTYSVVNIDTSAPSTNLAVGTMYTDRTTITATCSDSESGITKYEFSKDNGATWIANGTNKTYTFTGLTQGTSYTFAVRCTNGSALTKTASKSGQSTTIDKAVIVQISEEPGGMAYATKRVFRITYSSTNVVSPKFYYSLDGTTWTEVTNGTTKELTFTSNGKIYAKTVDPAGNVANAVAYSVVNIDTSAPSASLTVGTLKTDRATLTATCSDSESGITKYEYSKDNGLTWVSNGTTASYTFTGLTQNKSYTYAVRCTNGSGITKTASKAGSTTAVPSPTIAQVSQTPTGTTYAQSLIVRITYYNTNVVNPKYYYSLDGSTWVEVTSGTTKDLTFNANGKVYAKTTDAAGNVASASTFTVSSIDTSAPTASIAIGNIKTDRATVTATCSDSESGITKYEFSKDNGSTWVSNGTTNTYTFTGLTQGTTYNYAIRCTNGSGMTKTATEASQSQVITKATITQISQTPSDTPYAQARVLRITFYSENVVSPKYYYSTDGTNWTQLTSGTSKDLTFTANGKLYAKTTDASGNTASAITFVISKMDVSAPSASLTVGTIKSDRATLTAVCSDSESGITKYEYSKDNGSTWVANGTTASYTFTGLTQSKSYTYAVRCTNGSGMTKTASQAASTTAVPAPTIAQSSQNPSGTTYAQSRVIRITYTSTNVESPKYYYSTDGTNWTQLTSGTTKDITFTAAGKVYAKTTDATGNTASASTFVVSNMDTTAPSASLTVGTLKTDRATLTATCSDSESGITKYEYSKDNGSTWVANGTTASYTFTGLTQSKSYTYAVRCTNGSGMTKTASQAASTTAVPAPTIAQVSQTPSGTTYARSRVIRITYTSTNVTSPKYYYSTDGTNWTQLTSATTKDITFTAAGKVYAKTTDATGNTASASTFVVSNMDTTAPSKPTIALKLGSASGSTYTSGSWTNQDVYHIVSSSDAASGISYYQYSHDGSTSWSNDISTLGWGSSYNSNKTQLTYRINWSGQWNFYVRAVDAAGNISSNSDVFTVRIDKTAPTVSATVSGKTATFTMGDSISLVGYGVNQSSSTQPSYTAITGTTSTTKTWTASAAGTYYVWVKDHVGNVNKVSFAIANSAFNYAATDASYTATAACNSGGTPQNNNSCYYSSNSTVCGSSPYNCNCTKVECNCTDQCVGGNESYTYTGTCNGSDSFTAPASQGCSIANVCAGKSNCNCSCSGGDGSTVNCTTTWTYSCQKTGTRWNDCLTTNRVCGQCDSCQTCYSANSCSKTDSTYLYYTCPNGGTVSGTKCIKYTCPNGGTLSGTTCTF